MLVPMYYATRRHMQEYCNFHGHSYENIIYQIHDFDLYIAHYLKFYLFFNPDLHKFFRTNEDSLLFISVGHYLVSYIIGHEMSKNIKF
jgi:hypothetical protein